MQGIRKLRGNPSEMPHATSCRDGRQSSMTDQLGALWIDGKSATKAMKRVWRKHRHVFRPPLSLRQWAYRMASEESAARNVEYTAARWLERKS